MSQSTLRDQLLVLIQKGKKMLAGQLQAGDESVLCYQRSQPAAQAMAKPTAAPVRTPAKSSAATLTPLQSLTQAIGQCTQCSLAQTRARVVVGEGNLQAQLVLVGEAPGTEEDKQGRPFVGADGQLLNRMLVAIGTAREEVYVCNILKCRPPGNRNPQPEEIAACRPFLVQQLGLLKPKLIAVLGTFAAQTLLQTTQPINQLRGRIHQYEGIPVVVTFHPAALLYHPQNKQLAWQDLKLMARQLGLAIKQ